MSVNLDLRWDTAPEDMHAVGEPVLYHNNLDAINVILPGLPDSSAAVLMMEDLRMPPSDLWRPHTEGIEQVAAWIEVLGG